MTGLQERLVKFLRLSVGFSNDFESGLRRRAGAGNCFFCQLHTGWGQSECACDGDGKKLCGDITGT